MPKLNVFELRSYTLHPGKRDVLIELFECEFVESQEEIGSYVAATFRNLDDPDRFVWFRGFENMHARATALDGFYTGAVWQRLRNAANATIIDSDDVLLLRPLSGAAWATGNRPPIGAVVVPNTLFVCVTYFVHPKREEAFASFFADEIAPSLRDTGAEIVATLATEHSANSYPRLPVRENETVYVALLRPSAGDADGAKAAAAALSADMQSHTVAPPHIMRLQPTARSALC